MWPATVVPLIVVPPVATLLTLPGAEMDAGIEDEEAAAEVTGAVATAVNGVAFPAVHVLTLGQLSTP